MKYPFPAFVRCSMGGMKLWRYNHYSYVSRPRRNLAKANSRTVDQSEAKSFVLHRPSLGSILEPADTYRDLFGVGANT